MAEENPQSSTGFPVLGQEIEIDVFQKALEEKNKSSEMRDFFNQIVL